MSELERLRAAMADPARWVRDPHAARAAALLREHVMHALGDALSRAGTDALVIKGEALARTVYPEPWMRPMGDIDLVVRARDRERVEQTMVDAGFLGTPAPQGRWLTLPALDETIFLLRVGDTSFPVELHRGVDKLVSRPIPMDEVFERAVPLAEGLLAPSREHHVALVAIDAATADMAHPVALLDLHRLLAGGIDEETLLTTALSFRARTALWLTLETLQAAGTSLPLSSLLGRLRPAWPRERAVALFYRPGHYPAHRALDRGWRWAVRQTALRDDTLRWLAGSARYGVYRLAERVRGISPR